MQCGAANQQKSGKGEQVFTSEAPPALSAGPHMENQVSGPLGTGVDSPLGSSQSATEAAQVPGPLTTLYSRKSFTSAGTGRETFAHQTETAAAKANAVSNDRGVDASLIHVACRKKGVNRFQMLQFLEGNV